MSKSREMLDAVKTATSIHKGDYSSLRGKSFLIIDNGDKIKKKKDHHIGDKTMKESRLDKIEESLAQISNSLTLLNQKVDGINTRLDYVVKANDLKDLSKSK